MFDLGFLEIMTIGIVALVVIGPERLPEVAAKVGRYVGKAQRFVRGVRSDISRELETGDLKKLIGDQKEQIDELRQMVHTATKDIESSTSGAMRDAQNSMTSLGDDVKSAVNDGAADNANASGQSSSGDQGSITAGSSSQHDPASDLVDDDIDVAASGSATASATDSASNKDASNP